MANNVPDLRNKMVQKVSPELICFADSLAPSADYIRVGKETLQKVFARIQKDPKFRVDRCLPGGSVGKNTSVLFPDFDAVIFLHNQRPPLLPVVENFKTLLENEADSFGIIEDSITWSSNTVTLEFKNGVEMDLLPACSLSQDPEEQYKKILEILKEYQDNYLTYSSSLADIQLKFMKEQPGSTHQLIRLVKYWYKNLPVEKVYGGSYLMEILCVTVCMEDQKVKAGKSTATKSKSLPMYEAFKTVLQKLSSLYVLKIAFLRKNKQYRLLSEHEINQHKNDFGAAILKRSRYIIDPSNPYNDILKNLNEEDARKIKEFATTMLKRIEKLENPESDDLKVVFPNQERVTIHIDKVFAPVIMRILDFCPAKPKPARLPTLIAIHYDYQNFQSSESKIKPQNKVFFYNNPDAEMVSKFTRKTLECLVRGKAKRLENGSQTRYIFTDGLPDIDNKKDVKEAVELFLTAQELPKNTVKVETENKVHNNCDVALYIPYFHKNKKLAVRFSMKWNGAL